MLVIGVGWGGITVLISRGIMLTYREPVLSHSVTET